MKGGTKKCSKCSIHKQLDCFGNRASSKDGKQSICKECKQEVNRSYYETVQDQPKRLRAPALGNSLTVRFPLIAAFWDDEMNDVAVDAVSARSRYTASFRCPDCSHSWEANLNALTRSGDRNSICPECHPKTSVALSHPEWVTWWDDTRFSPDSLSAGSKTVVRWRCPNGHSFSRQVRRFKLECSSCDVQKKSLSLVAPHVAAEWHPVNAGSPSDVSYNSSRRVLWLCGSCAHTWDSVVYQRVNSETGCPKCALSLSTNKPEEELHEWLLTVLPEQFRMVRHDKKVLAGKELDFYFPDIQFAIEFNGLYWHSEEQGTTSSYHYDKWSQASTAGVQLYTVWEDDWLLRKDVVKQGILHKMGFMSGERVFARKTVVEHVSYRDAKAFLDEHHIQGAVTGSYYVGLQHEGELVAMSVWKKQADDLYLERYATSVHVVGGMGKLLKYVIQHHSDGVSQLVTFAAHDVSNGSLYNKLGFTVDRELPPDYMYVVNGERKHKFGYRVERFRSDAGLKFEAELTEKELALLNGFLRVWDAGKTRYIFSLQ